MASPRDSTSAIEIPGPWQHRYVAANGARFHVAESLPPGQSERPLVLLLHGFPEFWWSWRDQLPALAAAGYRAAAMDLRGYGGSDKTPRGYDPVTLAQDVAGVIKSIGQRNAVVVGHGWGGYIAWAAATLHPREVSALCVVAAPHPRVLLRSPRLGITLAGLGHLMAMQVPYLPERRLSLPETGFLAAHLKRWTSSSSDFPDNATIAVYQDAVSLWPASHCALEYHRWLLRSRFRYDGRHFNDLMQRPVEQSVCSVNGAEDPALPSSSDVGSRRWVAGDFEGHVIANAGHFPHEEQPERFTAVLLDWLERHG